MSIAPARDEVREQLPAAAGAVAVRAACVKTEPSGLTVGVPQTGQLRRRPRRPARGPRARRRAAPGETTCGITSPARSTITSSPRRTSLRARSSSLCSVASLTVTPPTWTGSSTANGCRSPNLPTFHWIVEQRRDRRRRRELPGDRPARVAPDDAQPPLQLEVVDLHDDAVDLEVQRAAALLPRHGSARRPRPRSSSRTMSRLTRKPCSRSHSSAVPVAVEARGPRSRRRRRPTSTAAARPQPRDRAGGSCPAAELRGFMNVDCAGLGAALVERREVGERHVDLAAHLEQRRRVLDRAAGSTRSCAGCA